MARHFKNFEEEIYRLLYYDEGTGVFLWKRAPDRKPHLLGFEAGTLRPDNYLCVKIAQRNLLLHRVAVFIKLNIWVEEVDHRNRIRNDNRWDNLIVSNRWLNSQNIPIKEKHTSGIVGVCQTRAGWVAYIQRRWLGTFKTKDEAVLIRQNAERGLRDGSAL